MNESKIDSWRFPPKLAALLLAAPAIIAAPLHGQCGYEVTVVPAPTTCSSPMVPYSINNLGHTCGYFNPCGGSNRPFYWSPETGVVEITFGFPIRDARATSINDSDVVTGYVQAPSVGWTTFRWKDGVAELLIPLPDFPKGKRNYANWASPSAITSTNLVLGTYGNFFTGLWSWTFLWSPTGETSIPSGLLNVEFPKARDMNEHGMIVGAVMEPGVFGSERALIVDGEDVLILPPAPQCFNSFANCVNNYGRVVGIGQFEYPAIGYSKRGFMWIDGAMVDLGVGVPQSHSEPFFEPTAVNDLDQVVGYMGGGLAVLWQSGSTYLLHDLIAQPGFFFVEDVASVNDRGDIVSQDTAPPTTDMVILRPIRSRPGDVTVDCKVNAADIEALVRFWGSSYAYDLGPGDLNGDRFVDGYDLAYVLADWGE